MTQVTKGKLIIFGGIDGSGKSTAVALLQKDLTTIHGREVRVVNILKDHPASAQVRAIVTGSDNNVHPDAEACLYAGAVLNTYHLVVVPLLEQGIDVICDRSWLCAMAYQGTTQAQLGNHRPLEMLRAIYSGNGSPVSDAIVMLYTDPTKGLERVLGRDAALDRIEQRGTAYQQSVQEAYSHYCASISTEQQVFEYHNNSTLEDLAAYINNVAWQIAK